jgi:hypothetical protein
MATVHFLGRVLPKVVKVSLGHKPKLKWESPDIGLTMEFTNHITDSNIDVECTLNRWTPDDFVAVYMRALDLCRASVNVVAFAMGCGLTVFLDTFVDPSGAHSPILCNDDRLRPLCTAFTLTAGFDEIHAMVLQNPTLFMALNDLILAITLPHVSSVNCARAMERLKHLIAPNSTNDVKAWQQMREALRIGETYLKFITRHSVGPRHGSAVHVPGAVTTEVTRRAWTIMNRYFEYRKKGGAPLTAAEFPLLKG